MLRLLRIVSVLAVALVAILPPAPPVSADPPIARFSPAGIYGNFVNTSSCPFPVQQVVLEDNMTFTVKADSAGNPRAGEGRGTVRVREVNVNTGKSQEYTFATQITFTFDPVTQLETIVIHGTVSFFVGAGFPAVPAQAIVVHGSIFATANNTGPQSFQTTGRVEDLCAILGP